MQRVGCRVWCCWSLLRGTCPLRGLQSLGQCRVPSVFVCPEYLIASSLPGVVLAGPNTTIPDGTWAGGYRDSSQQALWLCQCRELLGRRSSALWQLAKPCYLPSGKRPICDRFVFLCFISSPSQSACGVGKSCQAQGSSWWAGL